jgi:hypothetical protein
LTTEQQHPNKETYQALPLLLYLLGVPYHSMSNLSVNNIF